MSYLDNTFGVEIECYVPEGGNAAAAADAISARLAPLGSSCVAENYGHLTRPHWKIVPDGSLGDYQRGIEVVSPVLRGEAGIAQLTAVLGALSDYGAIVNKRCGLHVHVGVRDDTQFFKRLLQTYAKYEAVIDGFMPASRRGNSNAFCRSVAALPAATIARAADLNTLLNVMGRGSDAQRYYKLNLSAYRRHATVEFRQHSGTIEASKATSWLRFCLRMVEAARVAPVAVAVASVANNGRANSKARLVGDMLLRPEGVTAREAMAATGWPSISLPQQARICGIAFTTVRTSREVRYFAARSGVVAAPVEAPATLDALLSLLGCEAAEVEYFQARTRNLSGRVQWAA
jgi:hypothetical protein